MKLARREFLAQPRQAAFPHPRWRSIIRRGRSRQLEAKVFFIRWAFHRPKRSPIAITTRHMIAQRRK